MACRLHYPRRDQERRPVKSGVKQDAVLGTRRARMHMTCGKGSTQVRRSALDLTDGDTSGEHGRGLKFGEPVVGKVGILD